MEGGEICGDAGGVRTRGGFGLQGLIFEVTSLTLEWFLLGDAVA